MKSQTSYHSSQTLRRALKGNALFSLLSGIVILIFTKQLANVMSMSGTMSLYIVGSALILFGISLFADARRETINKKSATSTIVMDMVWVAGSCAALIVPLGLSGSAKGLITVTALIVGFFAIWQWKGLQIIRRNEGLSLTGQTKR